MSRVQGGGQFRNCNELGDRDIMDASVVTVFSQLETVSSLETEQDSSQTKEIMLIELRQ